MKFSEWTKRVDSHVIDNAAGDAYEELSERSKENIDRAIERFIQFKIENGSLLTKEKVVRIVADFGRSYNTESFLSGVSLEESIQEVGDYINWNA